MNLREGLATALATGLGTDYRVIGYPATLDGINKPTVCLWANSLKALPQAPNGNYEVTYTVQVFTGHQDASRADTDLDNSMEEVLAILWNLPGYLLDGAERTTSQDSTIHSWTLTLRGGITISED